MGQESIMMIALGVILIIAGVYFIISKSQKKGNSTNKMVAQDQINEPAQQTQSIKRPAKPIEQRDMSEFLKFDKIANDMIYQNKGEKYTMVIQCKGVNYHLMSEIEQMAVEEGFIMFLNTLKFPIQLYVQTRSIDLSENVKSYKQKVREFAAKQDEVTAKYNAIEDDIDSTQEEIDYMKKEKLKYTNIAEYVSDITRYVEVMALNKHMLQRNFYIVFSYHKSELATTEKFTKEEYEDLCYRELYTRAQAIISSLITCSVSGRILNSNELAQLIYSSINRDDAKLMSIKDALDAGIFRLYTTSEDVFRKRREMLEAEIEEEGRKRVEEAVKEAIAKGLIVTEAESEESAQKEIDRRAIKIIDKSAADENVKQQLKNVIKDNRRKRLAKLQETLNNQSQQDEQEKNEDAESLNENIDVVEEKVSNEEETINEEPINIEQHNEEITQDENITDDILIQDDELIIDTKEGDKADE